MYNRTPPSATIKLSKDHMEQSAQTSNQTAVGRSEDSAPLRVALVQFKPKKADVPGNLQQIRDTWLPQAGDAEVVVFPEASLTGYFLEGGVVDVAMPVEEVAKGLGVPGPMAPTIILGFYEKWRRGIYNSVACFEAGEDGYEATHVHRKMFLPTYGVFEEARFADPGRDLTAFNTRHGRLGLLVCEEMWHSLPPTILALDGAELIVVVSASPARDFPEGIGRSENLARWDALTQGAASEHGVFVAVCQLVGSEGGKVFLGGSMIAGPDGSILAQGPLMEEGLISVDLDGRSIDRARFQTPLLADLRQMLPHLQRALDRSGTRGLVHEEGEGGEEEDDGAPESGVVPLGGSGPLRPTARAPKPQDAVPAMDMDLVRKILVDFIREEVVTRRGFDGVVLGVSGGVDSAVALYLAVEALGPERVMGFRLPYATSSPESLEHAALILSATGAQTQTIDITPSVDAYVQRVDPELSDLRRGNLAARLRGITLFDQSAKLGRLPLGTGNKSERLLGYFTWHADDSPPINPIGDLFKTQVWDLARHLGVPDVIVEKPASADLVRGIHDEDELGVSYREADPILHWLLSGYRPEELISLGFARKAVEAVWGRFNGTHWKRELPTVAVLSGTAIGEFFLRPVDY
jgi:NAD+ synthase (glutamine-hydrolysing)